jgi:hypothetical protein
MWAVNWLTFVLKDRHCRYVVLPYGRSYVVRSWLVAGFLPGGRVVQVSPQAQSSVFRLLTGWPPNISTEPL